MKIYLITAAVFAVAWLVAWFAFLRPALKHYAITAGVMARIEAVEGGLWAKIKIWLEAKKTVLVSFLGSGVAAFKAAAGMAAAGAVAAGHAANGLSATDVMPLQDKTLWSTLVGESWALYIVSGIGILTAFLTLKGKIAALWIVPADKA